jgi:hypothetical protein
MFSLQDIIILQTGVKNFMKRLTTAVEDGSIVILESVGQELDASLDALLSQQTTTKGSQKFMRLGSGYFS